MASITVRDPDDDVKTRLRVRAAEHHRSMEEEARIILRDAVNDGRVAPRNLAKCTAVYSCRAADAATASALMSRLLDGVA